MLGVVASLLMLYLLDPYVPDFGLIAFQKPPSSSASGAEVLLTMQSMHHWVDFKPFRIPSGAVVIAQTRSASAEQLINPKYALMAPRSKIHDSISVRFIGPGESAPVSKTIFDAVYTTDEVSRRTTVPAGPAEKATAQIAFLGCSFTWGSGVDDTETFSSIVAQKLPTVRVLNLGIRGGAPNDFIDDLTENPQRLKPVDGVKKGVVVLTMIADHIERALCKTRCYTEPTPFKALLPTGPFRLDKTRYVLHEGTLTSAGSFRGEGEWLTNLKTLTFKSRILTKLYYDYSGYPSADDLYLFAKMVERVRDLAIKETGHDFVVAFFPDGESRSTMKLLKLFDELHISYFDYSKLRFDETLGHRAFYEIDRHPTAIGHAAYAELLLRDLRKRTPALFDSN